MPSQKTDKPICQSCTYSLEKTAKGTEADGSLSSDYCHGCFQDGKFTEPEITMKEMIEKSLKFTAEDLNITIDEARSYLESIMPTLKRWR